MSDFKPGDRVKVHRHLRHLRTGGGITMTNTNRFHLGDKIKAGPFTADLGLTPGNIYTVHHIDDFGKIQPDTDRHHHYHPSHFKLVERAVPDIGRYGHDADMPCYSLKDGEGDWWVYETEDPRAVGAWHLVAEPHVTREGTDEGVDAIVGVYGIDNTPTAAPETYCEPEPPKKGDWVQVWARFVREDNLGMLVVATPTGAGGEGCRNTYASPDAIVRPAEGQVPPWVEEAQKAESEAISNITATLRREGGMDYDAAHKVAASLYRAGVRSLTEGGAS